MSVWPVHVLRSHSLMPPQFRSRSARRDGGLHQRVCGHSAVLTGCVCCCSERDCEEGRRERRGERMCELAVQRGARPERRRRGEEEWTTAWSKQLVGTDELQWRVLCCADVMLCCCSGEESERGEREEEVRAWSTCLVIRTHRTERVVERMRSCGGGEGSQIAERRASDASHCNKSICCAQLRSTAT